MFLSHYTCSVLRSRNSRKAFKFLSKCLVLLLYGNQYRILCFVHKTTYLWSMSSPGGGELSLFACPGVGNRPPSKKKIANPGGMPGGVVTGRIEPCINGVRVPYLGNVFFFFWGGGGGFGFPPRPDVVVVVVDSNQADVVFGMVHSGC